MGLAASTGLTAGIVICAGIGVLGLVERTRSAPDRRLASFEVISAVDVALEPSSSSVQHEPPVLQPPFYASLFVAGATWTSPCTFGMNEEPSADAMVLHHGAWCRIHEFQGWDSSFGTSECISRRGIVGSSYRRDMMGQRCGDVP